MSKFMNISGFTLKGVKEFKGHEGETCYQGNIYLNNKKVGYFSSSYTMGPMDVRFDNNETAKLFKEVGKKFHEKFPKGFLYGHAFLESMPMEFWDEEAFILELLEVKHAEELYKKASKQGIKFLYFVYNKKEDNVLYYRSNALIPKRKFAEKGEELFLFVNSLDTFNIEL